VSGFDFYTSTASRFYAPVAAGIWGANWELGCESLGIPGHFALLSHEVRGRLEDDDTLPRYTLSWVPDTVDADG
jgi:hypothetical protein